jgi:hypothetical protein
LDAIAVDGRKETEMIRGNYERKAFEQDDKRKER